MTHGHMPKELLEAEWADLNSAELLMFCRDRLHAFGQFDSQRGDKETIYFPEAREACEFAVTMDAGRVLRIKPGATFDAEKWDKIAEDIDKTLIAGTAKVGREYSFSAHRVLGSWRGSRSGVQILPPPPDAPRAPVEMAEHPFILEFPITPSDFWPITNRRRLVEHRKFTLLLNALLRPRINIQNHRPGFFWGNTGVLRNRSGWSEKFKQWLTWLRSFVWKPSPKGFTADWVQHYFFANLGPVVTETLSDADGDRLQEVASNDYYTNVGGHDGQGLRVPTDLDESICLYVRCLLLIEKSSIALHFG
jgi:hypothetical protein